MCVSLGLQSIQERESALPRVKFVDLGFLRVFERLVQLVDVERLFPLLGIDPHLLRCGYIEFTGPEESAAPVQTRDEYFRERNEMAREGSRNVQEHGIIVLRRIVEAFYTEFLLELRDGEQGQRVSDRTRTPRRLCRLYDAS